MVEPTPRTIALLGLKKNHNEKWKPNESNFSLIKGILPLKNLDIEHIVQICVRLIKNNHLKLVSE